MRISIAQINPVLADFKYNREKILSDIQKASNEGCDLVVFPECTLFGYHPFDLLERAKIVEQQEKEFQYLLKKIPKGLGVVLGLITKNPNKKGRPYYNSAAFLVAGKKPQFFHKQLLPTGDVFDEARFIEAGNFSNNYFSWKGKKFFLTICEDIWAWPDPKGNSPYRENPLAKVKRNKIDLVINLSASPYHVGKLKKRRHVTHQTAKYFKAPILYTNLVGAQDEIVFDGASFIMNPQGKVLGQCNQFAEDFKVFDLEDLKTYPKAAKFTVIQEIHKALVLGMKDFFDKTGIKKVHLGLSGGIDSAVVAALAVDALGAENVVGIALPTKFNAHESLDLARQLADNLKIEFHEVEIQTMFESVTQALAKPFAMNEFSVVHENIQARIRGMTLMAYSNRYGSILLTTSNKTEMACGYSTMYGDMCGGLAPIGDLTKGQVYDLARWYNKKAEIIPEKIITRAPSAELRPNQKDQDSLPAYDLLDQAVVNLVADSKVAKTATEKWLLPMLMRTEFKRWQAAPVLKVSEHAFGRGRRYPIAHKGLG